MQLLLKKMVRFWENFIIKNKSEWTEIAADVLFEDGIVPIYLKFSGTGMFDIKEISF